MWLVSLKDFFGGDCLIYGFLRYQRPREKQRSDRIYKFIASKYRTWNGKQPDETSGLGPPTKTLPNGVFWLIWSVTLFFHRNKRKRLLNSRRISWGHQHGGRDVTWKHFLTVDKHCNNWKQPVWNQCLGLITVDTTQLGAGQYVGFMTN